MHLAAALDHQPAHAAVRGGPRPRSAGRRGWPPSTTVATAPSRRSRQRHRPARAVDELLAVAGGEEVAARVEAAALGDGDLHRGLRQPAHAGARRAAPASAPAAAGCRCAPSPRRPGSRRTRRGPASTRSRSASLDSTSRSLGGGVEVAVERDAAAQHRVRTLSHGRTRSTAAAARPSAGRGAVRAGRRRTTAPGRLATSTIAPYATAVATPCAAPSPAAPNAQAATPSRGPQPATFSRQACGEQDQQASGSSVAGGAVTPTARAASEERRDVPGHRQRRGEHDARPGRRTSSPRRTSARHRRRTRPPARPVRGDRDARSHRQAGDARHGADPGHGGRGPARAGAAAPPPRARPARPGRRAAPRRPRAARARCRPARGRGARRGARRRGRRRAASALRNCER